MSTVALLLNNVPLAAASEFNAGGELLRVLLSLAGVVVLIFVAGWFSRRLQVGRTSGGRRIRCVETFALGTRDRIVLLEADGQRLLIGTGTGGMHTLHVYEHAHEVLPAAMTPPQVPRPAFADLLARWKIRS
ncbi:MAG: flagellar biosynthetic protein FliO [Rhodanobacter sp.]